MALELERFLKSLIRSSDEEDLPFLRRQLEVVQKHNQGRTTDGIKGELRQLTARLKEGSVTKSLVEDVWVKNWQLWSSKTGVHVDIQPVDVTDREVQRIYNDRRMLIYVPNEVTDEGSWKPLIDGFCEGGGSVHTDQGFGMNGLSGFANTDKQSGWMITESTGSAPPPPEGIGIRDTRKIREKLRETGQSGMTLNTYVVASSLSARAGRVLDDAEGFGFVVRLNVLPETVAKEDNEVFLCSASQKQSGFSVHFQGMNTVKDYQFDRMGVRTVRRIETYVQRRLF